MYNMLRSNQLLYNSLYPRNKLWNENLILNDLNESDDQIIDDKIHSNAFIVDDNEYSIGEYISNFNHSKNPNSFTNHTTVTNDIFNTPMHFISLYAYKDININEEITFLYNNTISFNNNKNNIPFNYDEYVNYYKMFINTHRLYHSIIKQYINKTQANLIYFNQLCLKYGLYRHDNIIAPVARLNKYIKYTFNINNVYTGIPIFYTTLANKITHII